MKKALAIAVLALFGSAANADAGGYVGIGLGQTSVDIEPGWTSTDDSDTGFKIFGGYSFNKTLAIEFGYADFGTATADDSTIPLNASFEATAIFFDVVAGMPINDQFSLFGRAGLAFTSLDATATIPGVGSASISEDEPNLKFGIGVQYSFTQNVAARVEWERYLGLGEDATTGESDLDMIGASFVMRF